MPGEEQELPVFQQQDLFGGDPVAQMHQLVGIKVTDSVFVVHSHLYVLQ